MPISSQGAQFSFPGISGLFTSISVEEPEMELVDMTGWDEPFVAGRGRKRIVATGDMKSPGRIVVDYLREPGGLPPLEMRGAYGNLVLTIPEGPGGQVIVFRRAYLASATTEISTGDIVRGRITFQIDHTYD